MKTPSLKNVDAWNADVVAGAVKFTATLFLGAGKYTEEVDATTAEEIQELAKMLKADHADNNRDVIIYAFDADGNKSLVSGTPYKGAEKKGVTLSSPLADIIREAAENPPEEPKAFVADPNSPAVQRMVDETLAAAEITDLPLMNLSAKPSIVALPGKPAKEKAPKAEKPAKPAKPTAEEKEAAKAKAKADREAAKAAQPAKVKEPTEKEKRELAAAAGELPETPDFSKDTHKPFRKKLAAIVAMIEANDIAALKAETTEPKSSSRNILCRYRDLAIIALEAQAAAKKGA